MVSELLTGLFIGAWLVALGFIAGLFVGLYKTRRMKSVTHEYYPNFKTGKTQEQTYEYDDSCPAGCPLCKMERSVNADYQNTEKRT